LVRRLWERELSTTGNILLRFGGRGTGIHREKFNTDSIPHTPAIKNLD
jgi:hypothetical protein